MFDNSIRKDESTTRYEKKCMVKRNRQARGVCCVSREELAAIELLKSTGAPLLEAAQVACAALRFAQGEVMRAMKCIELGSAEAEKWHPLSEVGRILCLQKVGKGNKRKAWLQQ